MHSIWAIAVNTLKQAIRIRVAVVFIVLLAVLLPVLGFSATGDGTVKGRLQTFVSYGLSLTSLLLCLLTVAVSVYTLTSDIRQKQIYTVLTKPVRRVQLLAGKLLGVILLDALLLSIFAAVIYAIVVYTPALCGVSAEQKQSLNDEFFTARASLKPLQADVTEQVRKAYERLKQSGRLDELFQGASEKKIIEQLTKQHQLQARSAAPGQELIWEFENVRPAEPNQNLYLRFKYDVSVNPPDFKVYGWWRVGDLRQINYGLPVRTPIREYRGRDLIRTAHEVEFSSDVVADDGYLAVAFRNVPLNNTTIIFGLDDGLEILYKADSFTANYLRAVLLIFFRLVFLAVLGLLAGSFLSFPVALLLCVVVFFTANFSSFILDSFSYLSDNVGAIYSYSFKPIMLALPRFDRYDVAGCMIAGRLLSWQAVARTAGIMLGIKALLLLAFSVLIFGYREVAKVTV